MLAPAEVEGSLSLSREFLDSVPRDRVIPYTDLGGHVRRIQDPAASAADGGAFATRSAARMDFAFLFEWPFLVY